MSTPLMDTLYNTFLMMDETGLIVATPGKCESKLLKPLQVAALFSFFQRRDVLTHIVTTMRGHLDERAATDDNLRVCLAMIDAFIIAPAAKRAEPVEEPEPEEKEETQPPRPPLQIATIAGEPVMLTYDSEEGTPNGVEMQLGELELAFDLGAEERDVNSVYFSWDPQTYVYLTVAQAGHLKEVFTSGTLDRLISIGRDQDRRAA